MILGRAMSRRDVLLACYEMLNDYNTLVQVVGKDATLDCTLYSIAKHDPVLLKRLNSVLSVSELEEDIKHIVKSGEIEKQKEKLKKELM